MPINLFTINALYGLNLTPEKARDFIAQEAVTQHIAEPVSLEEKALSQVGRPLYEAFIRNYTAKQWEKQPSDLPASILTRLPVRYPYDIGYFSDPWQGVPADGFARLFARMADHPLIGTRLNCEFASMRQEIPTDARVIYTGMPDALFDYKHGALEWRSLRFEWEHLPMTDFQGTAVMNYVGMDVPFTRIHEFKHYNPERKAVFEAPKTVICREYPQSWKPGAEAYYPIPSERNSQLYERYAEEAKDSGLILGGRLGGYKYLDMDKAVADAMQTFARLSETAH